MFSVSFGCNSTAIDAQKGTACMVCRGLDEARNPDSELPLYDVARDAVYDYDLDDICYIVGKRLKDGDLPAAYCALDKLENSTYLKQDFKLFYSLCDLENRVKQTGVDRKTALKDALGLLDDIANYIKGTYDLSETECAVVLGDIENQLLNECVRTVKEYDGEWYTIFARRYVALYGRTDDTTELRKCYEKMFAMPTTGIKWDDSPLSKLIDAHADADIISKIAAGEQSYKNRLSECPEILSKLLELQAGKRASGDDDIADRLLERILKEDEEREELTNINIYADKLNGSGHLSEEAKPGIKQDVIKLLEAHKKNIFRTESTDYLNVLREQKDLYAVVESLGFAHATAVELLAGIEKVIPGLYAARTSDYDEELTEMICARRAELIVEGVDVSVFTDAVVKPFNLRLEWLASPLYMLCGKEYPDLLDETLKNGQEYAGAYEQELHKVLMDKLRQARLVGNDTLADDLLGFVTDKCNGSETLLNPNAYLELYKAEDSVSDKVYGDIERLCERHGTYCREEIHDIAGAKAELDFEDRFLKLLAAPPFGRERALLRENMLLPVPEWFAGDDAEYDDEIYSRILARALDGGENRENVLAAYGKCIAHRFDRRLTAERCPLRHMLDEECGRVKNWEARVCKNALELTFTVGTVEELIKRIVSLRAEDCAESAEAYITYVTEKFPRETAEFVTYYISKMGEIGTRKAREKREALFGDVTRLLKLNNDGEQPHIMTDDALAKLSEWYAINRDKSDASNENDELTEQLEKAFTLALKDALDKRRDCAEITLKYCDPARLCKNEISNFWKELIERLRNCGLRELNAADNRVLEAAKKYAEYDGKRKPEMRALLKNALERERNHTPGDIYAVVNISKALGLETCTDEINEVLRASDDYELNADALDTLMKYARDTASEADSVCDTLIKRCVSGDKLKRFENLYAYIECAYDGDSDKAAHFVQALEYCRENGGEITQDADFISRIIEEAGKYCAVRNDIKRRMTEWLDDDDKKNDALRKLLTDKLNIKCDDADAQSDNWRSYMLRELVAGQTEKMKELSCNFAALRDNALGKVAADIRRQAEKPGCAYDKDALTDELSSRMLRVLERDRDIIDDTAQLGQLTADVTVKLEQQGGHDLYTAALKKATYKYVDSILENDNAFNAVVHDAQSARDLYSGIKTVGGMGGTSKRRETLKAACDVMDYYDRIVAKKANVEDLRKAMRSRAENSDPDKLWRDIVLRYGVAKLKEAGTLPVYVPYLVEACKGISRESVNIDWMYWLSSVFPFASGRTWEKINIWRDDENAYGRLAAVLNWLSTPEYKDILKSFTEYIDATPLGRSARSEAIMKEFRKHGQNEEQNRNAMLKWLLKR